MTAWLLALFADAVFESAASTQRSFSGEMSRYLEKRGFATRPAPRPLPAR